MDFKTPVEPRSSRINPCQADFSVSVAPSSVFIRCSAISFRTPSVSRRAFLSSIAESAPDRKELNAATLRLSVSSRVVVKSTPFSLRLCSPAMSSSNVFTGPPSAFAKSPLASASFSMMFLVAVAAEDASNPELARAPSRAVVSLMPKPNVFATGPTVLREFCRYPKLSALLLVDNASAARVSSASVELSPNMRRAAPARAAASGSSAPTAVAKFRTGSSMAFICPWLKPSFASSV